jgi:hypothetical protein
MPHLSLRDQRDFEEFDEFVCERFCLLPPSSSISEINSLTRRLTYTYPNQTRKERHKTYKQFNPIQTTG